MGLVYRVISCDALGGSIACAWNSQMASSLSQIRVTCSTMKMSSFPLEIEKNIQAMKSYRFFQQRRTRDRSRRILDGSPTFASHRSAHFFGLFLVSGRVSSGQRSRMKRNTLSCVSCIATVSNNSYSLHSATILTHTIAYSHIFFSETKHCYSRNDVRS